MVSTRAVTTLAELEALAEAWQALVEASPRSTPLASPAWNLACWRHLRRGDLCALAVEADGGLVGVAPLFREPGSWRRLRWIGELSVPGTRNYPVSDYGDLIAAPGREADVCEAFWRWLEAHTDAWRVLDLGIVPPDGVLAAETIPPDVERSEDSAVFRLSLPATWDEYRASLSPNFRQMLGRLARKLEREHEVAHVLVHTPEELRARYPHLVRLHQQRWEADEQPGIFRSEAARAFYREAAEQLLAAGMLSLWFLDIDGEASAALFNFRLGDRVYYYSSGTELERHRKFAIGRGLIAHTIEAAIAGGCSRYDMLRGNYEYKERLGVERTPLTRVRAFAAPGWRASRRVWEGCVQAARAAKRTVRPHLG